MKKSIQEMSEGELRLVWMDGPTAVLRSSALNEYERRKAEQPNRVRAAIALMIDRVGIVEALSTIADICAERSASNDPAESFKWSIRMEAIRQAASESEAESC